MGGSSVTNIIDLDSHLMDASPELWKDHLPQSHAHLAPARVVDASNVQRLLIGNRLFPKPTGHGRGGPLGVGVSADCPALDHRLSYMAKLRIGRALLQPGFVGLAAMTTPERDIRIPLLEGHNRLVSAVASEASCLEPALAVSLADPEWSLHELERWSREQPVRAVVTRPTDYRPRPFRDVSDNALLRHLAEANVLLCLHGATGYYQVSPAADLFDDYRFTHALSHAVEQQIALADLLASGLMASGLKVAVLEAGCGWLPWLLSQLEAHFRHTGGCSPIALSPIEQARQSLLISVSSGDEHIEAVAGSIGPVVLAFGSDFPHWDAESETSVRELTERLDPALARGLFSENASRVLGLGAAPSSASG